MYLPSGLCDPGPVFLRVSETSARISRGRLGRVIGPSQGHSLQSKTHTHTQTNTYVHNESGTEATFLMLEL